MYIIKAIHHNTECYIRMTAIHPNTDCIRMGVIQEYKWNRMQVSADSILVLMQHSLPLITHGTLTNTDLAPRLNSIKSTTARAP